MNGHLYWKDNVTRGLHPMERCEVSTRFAILFTRASFRIHLFEYRAAGAGASDARKSAMQVELELISSNSSCSESIVNA